MFGHCGEGYRDFGRREFRGRHWRGAFGRLSEAFEHGMGLAMSERLFDAGDLRLVILQLISEKPSYGYEIIKAIEERVSGGYAPSPGVVYPSLTFLEEEGLAVSSTEGNKRLYTATEQGREYLKTNDATVKEIFGRMEQARQILDRGQSPQIARAFMNLRLALRMRAARGYASAEQVSKIAAALDAAARAIEEV